MKTRSIAAIRAGAYLGGWMGRLFHLVALLALVLMPIGMGTASASAAMPSAHSSMVTGSGGHCGDQSGKSPAKPVSVHCGGTCSALPDLAAPALAPVLTPTAKLTPDLVEALVGISPLPSIPPPRMG